MLEVSRRGKRELGENVREHVGGGAPNDGDESLFDEVSNVVVLDFNVFGLAR